MIAKLNIRRAMVNFGADFRTTLSGIHIRTVLMMALVALTFVVPGLTHAQSIGIEFGEADLAIFFTWFNTIFNALLPIALLGAGLTAGGLFVWVIASMLVRAFQNMMGRGRAG